MLCICTSGGFRLSRGKFIGNAVFDNEEEDDDDYNGEICASTGEVMLNRGVSY